MDTPTLHRIDKGKARAPDEQPSENTPLLASGSGSLTSSRDVSAEHPAVARRRLYSRLVSVFLVSLSVCVLFFVLLAIVAYSWRSRASDTRPEDIIQRALVLQGPDRVDVLNATSEDGVWLMVHGRMGLDAGSVVGVETDEDDSILQDWCKSIGRWGIRQLDRVTVTMSTIQVSPRARPDVVLATIETPPLEVPLTANPPPHDYSWLTPVQIPVRIKPTQDVGELLRFVRECWKNGFVNVQALVGQAVVRGGGLKDSGWRSQFSVSHANVRPVISMKIPSIPGLPAPGSNRPLPGFSELVTLQSFKIASTHGTIELSANATVLNPIPLGLELLVPEIPFIIFLPAPGPDAPSVPVASVHSHPFALPLPSTNISLAVSGTIVPLPRDSSGALSAFVSEYISGRDADIQISTPLMPSLIINTTFPAPHPRPEILRNVTITDMKIRPVGTTMVASGVVHALVVLPKGIEVGVNASRVFPDVLVFDGAVPDDDDDDSELSVSSVHGRSGPPPARPLPDPLPPRAFAHIVADDWLPAECRAVPSPPGTGSAVAVSAEIVDVPLEVLPGREREFSNFVSKVIFGSQGALAGVQGVAAVAVRVDGLPFAHGGDPEMELSGLPFQGSVRIGKKGS